MVGGAAGLVVWGGDTTVAKFKAMGKPVSAVELYFPDRVSSAVLAASEIQELDEDELTKLCDKFFNDTFLVDQNACSSPGMMFWVGEEKPERRQGSGSGAALANVLPKNINWNLSG